MAGQPNFLLFIPDGIQGRVTFPGHDCQTPNFDRLADRGVRFTRAYTALPTCSPARASLMTGLLPHNHGVLQVEHCVDDDQSVLRTQHPHWAQRLCDAGYHTGYFGKWHIERTDRVEDFGWRVNGCNTTAAFRALGAGVGSKERLLDDSKLVKFETGPEGYNDILHYGVTEVPGDQRDFALVTRGAREFLTAAFGQGDPWACCVSFPEPNTPLVAGRKAFERYDVDGIALPANLHNDFSDRPAFYRRQQQVHRDTTDREWREARAVYYALITELDEQFGTLLDHLEAHGQLDNTIVMVLGDHGRYVGAHGYDAHNFGAFEEPYNVPLIVAGPGVANAPDTDAVVSLCDLCPTILELAGAEPIDVPDSRSIAPLLADPAAQAPNFQQAYAEYHGTRFPMMQRILWQGPWKFVFNGFDYDELYNLADDPHEMKNLAGEPAHHDRVKAMMAEIWRIVHATNDRALAETHYSPMRFAAVGPNAGKGARGRHDTKDA